ncbi:23S rRNA (guanosine(2251)-2'-O)-methyltransferase RlmB [Legionella impletisoli]|uniref:23S rRNA (guanosine-2'-O-)-methyltransferase RlmB n=1 Tax=Legionella impletisoli TaxID=343510 RepID=A0A917JUT0_9GAMM|nr:23S rRNA (guanosine(2251)-2'-O)-methyltransferase RlmB [Legionella impletisoli]GGI87209.1 23S rRNA (guanosine-2'-O-)-methyltransferase RlmB [Legionella impletisoli]
MSEQYIYGIHAVMALLENPNRVIKQLYVASGREDKKISDVLNMAKSRKIPLETLSSQVMNQKFSGRNHQGLVALTESLSEYSERDIPELLKRCSHHPLILILDGVTDPHNLGACLRSADAAGVDFVMIPKDKSASITPVVSKVASGAAETMPVARVTNLVRGMEILKEHGVWIYGAAGEAKHSVYSLDFKGPTALIMGREGSGLRRLTREHCDGLFSLPMYGAVTSLNVSVAAGICLYEAVRQRL